ncbi:hypothetical protein HPB51_023677 [Rhipicephalus microplus]|uniref:HTH CENPB-type domain-containing protein n=1 Tax=Rhipicephalus microplus TaxID=6941 RepID=A0A9J6DWM6_RHIMP|nr:hypothetical protein HPB51_023677 [Rhipicephalus microplus]
MNQRHVCGAASPRSQWLKYSEPTSGRQTWVQHMLSQWAEGGPSSSSTPGSNTPSSRDWRTLMSSCLLVRLEEFSMQQFSAGRLHFGTRGKQLNSYTAGCKLKVIEFALEHGIRAAGRKFDVDEKCVRRWCAQKKALQNTNIKKRAFRGKQCKYPDLEEELLRYVTEVRNDGFSLTTDMLCMKALALARAKNIPAGDFKAGAGWVRRFLKRKGLSFRRRTTLCQRLPEDYTDKVCMAGRSQRRPFLASEGATVLLPGEALHLELTHYYARPSPATTPVTANGHVRSPGSGKGSIASSLAGSSVPEPHLFAYLGPTALRLDLATVLWGHAFLHSVHKCTAHLSCANGASPLAVRVEMILPKVAVPQFERERPLWPEEHSSGGGESRELQLGCSRAVATNWRPADRGACLEALGRGPLFFETTSFPWRPDGGGASPDPPPVHPCFLQGQQQRSNGGCLLLIHFLE